MSTDKKVTASLMTTLENGKEGFEKAAGLVESNDPAIAASFRRMAEQRSGFYDELQHIAKQYGDELEESGSVTAALHRGWMSLKDAASGSDSTGVLEAAEQGEAHAVKEYADALEMPELSADLRTAIARQHTAIKASHDEVKAMRESHAVKS